MCWVMIMVYDLKKDEHLNFLYFFSAIGVQQLLMITWLRKLDGLQRLIEALFLNFILMFFYLYSLFDIYSNKYDMVRIFFELLN